MRTILAAALALLPLAGCADQLVSDDRLRGLAAQSVGSPVGPVQNRRYDGFNVTRYRVSTPRGLYDCTAVGGHALDLGLGATAGCQRAS